MTGINKGGRIKGQFNRATAGKVAAVDALKASGMSFNKSVKEVGIGKSTYSNYKRGEQL